MNLPIFANLMIADLQVGAIGHPALAALAMRSGITVPARYRRTVAWLVLVDQVEDTAFA